jgi:hypothetical protein
VGDVLGEAVVARHHQPHHEGAEDQGDADRLGGVGGQQDAREDRGDPAAGHAADLLVGP